ncbi:MAG: response regulator transcription factor [Anaerolineae bacterium]|nr:response regulator transcription factor [Anaerolineae bacterium]
MRILLADNQPKVRFALRVLLERQAGLEVVGDAVDAVGLVSMAEACCPDLILLSWDLPGLAALDSLNTLRNLCPNGRIVILSGRPEAQHEAVAAGADAFVSKTDPPDKLLSIIAQCARPCGGGGATCIKARLGFYFCFI